MRRELPLMYETVRNILKSTSTTKICSFVCSTIGTGDIIFFMDYEENLSVCNQDTITISFDNYKNNPIIYIDND